eukprot:TRINITY_DN240_c0_g1_i5.p4 TRINITY_DN240_c0_g1~~TRINITY_DN240_c0_g1_i5.p4  ORF type:complete len:122 (-),score=4.05 TRINITY_DN240_c0_g1_i5:776-1141(-)
MCIRDRVSTQSTWVIMESLILAQDERWRRGLGMQVERERYSSEYLVEWRTGEQRVGNLPLSLGQPRETGINTRCGRDSKGGLFTMLLLKDEPAFYQLVGRVTAYQGDDRQAALTGGRPHWD